MLITRMKLQEWKKRAELANNESSTTVWIVFQPILSSISYTDKMLK